MRRSLQSVGFCFVKMLFCFCFLLLEINNVYSFTLNSTRVRRQTDISSCLLPPHPEFGQWSAVAPNFRFSPGEQAPSGTTLVTVCQLNYKLDGDVGITCINGRWTAEIGHCIKKCPPLLSTSTLTVTCNRYDNKMVNCTEASDGIVAKFKCADFYENSRHLAHTRDHITCYDGKWSDVIPECVPVCGQKIVKNVPTLIVNGSPVTKESYPWQVALYNAKGKSLICGGSLLNQRVIVTAAHCVTDSRGTMLPKELYIVAVGKYYGNFSDSRDANQTQFSSLHEMHVPHRYRGDIQNYFGDIAILITVKTFTYSYWVQPVCVDWESELQKELLKPTKKKKFAFVAGWGNTVEDDKPSEVLRELKVPLVGEEECLQNLPEGNEEYVTEDKLCAGYINSSTSACKGDSGGGLVFKYKLRYYLVAVVSISPQDSSQSTDGCNSQQYSLYTKIDDYIEDLILPKEARYGAEIACNQNPSCKDVTPITPKPSPSTELPPSIDTPRGNCVLPNHPQFGQWSVVGWGSDLEPGMSVPTRTVLQIVCRSGLKLNGSELILCNNGRWGSRIGECLKICPPLYSTDKLKVTCLYNNNKTDNCTDAVDGSQARFQCAPFYESLTLQRHPIHLCIDGTWDQPKPTTCVPVCGQRTVEAQPLIINGTTATKGSYPWSVAIYTKKDKTLICGGSLISQRIVLTAAHCVTDYLKGKILPKENYKVAAGKYYRGLDDPRDSKEAQFSDIQSIIIAPQYRGEVQKYFGNIALLVTQEIFTLSRRVQPVCLDFSENYKPVFKDYGYVTGWGFTEENKNPADVLKELKLPLISLEQCRDALPEDFEIYLTFDKFCAGYIDNSTGVCRGDSGGGLVFKHEGRYYITGIVSASPRVPTAEGGCDSNNYALYTNVSHYMNDFIAPNLAKFQN